LIKNSPPGRGETPKYNQVSLSNPVSIVFSPQISENQGANFDPKKIQFPREQLSTNLKIPKKGLHPKDIFLKPNPVPLTRNKMPNSERPILGF